MTTQTRFCSNISEMQLPQVRLQLVCDAIWHALKYSHYILEQMQSQENFIFFFLKVP